MTLELISGYRLSMLVALHSTPLQPWVSFLGLFYIKCTSITVNSMLLCLQFCLSLHAVSGQDHWWSMSHVCCLEGFGEDRGAVCPYRRSNAHEEAVNRLALCHVFRRHLPYPKVAEEPSIYCPSVRIMPFGPGPYLIIFVAPKMKPIINPTADSHR